jgi:hypothetical protein
MDKNQGSCNNGSGYNRWFKFQALEASVTIDVKTSGSHGTVKRLNAALWESNGTSQLACARYVYNDDDLTITYPSLTPGNWYYISVDNNHSSYRGTFTLCVDNVADSYYSRANGDWSNLNTWSYTNPASTPVTAAPTLSDVVFINGHDVTVTTAQTCAGVYMTPQNGNTSLTVNGAHLSVRGVLDVENNGYNNTTQVSITNSGQLTVNSNLELNRSGGSKGIELDAQANTSITVNGDFIMAADGGSTTQNEVTLTDAQMEVNGKGHLTHTSGEKSVISLNGASTLTFNDDVTLLAAAANKLEIEINDNSEIIFNGDLIRGTPAHGKITSNNNGTMAINGLLNGLQIPNNANTGTTDVITYQNLKLNPVSSATEYTLANDIQINGNLSIENGKIVVPADLNLTTNGAIENNSVITIEQGGTLIQTHTGANSNTGSGSYVIEQDGVASVTSYNIWSSPVQNASIPAIFAGSNPCDVYVFDGQSQTWLYDYPAGYTTNCNGTAVTFPGSITIAGGDAQMNTGVGYFAPGNTVSLRSFTGQVNNGDINVPIYTTNIGSNVNWNNDDWNLVGNPYPSALNAQAFWNENAVNNNRITDAVYFWDDNGSGSAYNQYADYATWNLLGGVQSGNSSVIPSGYIGVGQGFWVSAATNTNLVFNNSMRHTDNTQFFKNEQEQPHNVWVGMESPSGFENNILIGFNSQTTNAVDLGYDAHKNPGNANIKLASLIGAEECAIQAIEAIPCNSATEVFLSVFSAETGIHTFKEVKRENLNDEYTLYLKDHVNNTLFDLTTGDVQVQLQGNMNYTQRFSIVFKRTQEITHQGQSQAGHQGNAPQVTDSTTTGIDAFTQKFMTYQLANQELFIVNEASVTGTAYLYNISGQLLEVITVGPESKENMPSWTSLAQGIYIIELTSVNGQKQAHKIAK